MSDKRDPERDQPLAIVNDLPSCHDLVIADMAERKKFGLKKYTTPLQPNNGRSFLQDAYEEVLDLAVYLRGKLYEERNEQLSGNEHPAQAQSSPAHPGPPPQVYIPPSGR